MTKSDARCANAHLGPVGGSMRRGRRAAALLSMLLAGALALTPSAAAGTRDDPDVSGRCEPIGDEPTGATVDWNTPCSGWVQTVRAHEDAHTVLRFTLRLAEDITGRPPTASYSMRWGIGACRHSWWQTDRLDDRPETEFLVDCGVGRTRGRAGVSVPLPPDAFVEEGDELRVTLDFSLPQLAEHRHLYHVGAVLEGIEASAYNESYVRDPLGLDRGGRFGGQRIGPGRSYTVECVGDPIACAPDASTPQQ